MPQQSAGLTSRAHAPTELSTGTKMLVSGLGTEVTDEDLEELFTTNGGPVKKAEVFYKQDGTSTGTAVSVPPLLHMTHHQRLPISVGFLEPEKACKGAKSLDRCGRRRVYEGRRGSSSSSSSPSQGFTSDSSPLTALPRADSSNSKKIADPHIAPHMHTTLALLQPQAMRQRPGEGDAAIFRASVLHYSRPLPLLCFGGRYFVVGAVTLLLGVAYSVIAD